MKFSEPVDSSEDVVAGISPRILVMDDEPIIQDSLKELLENFGYRVSIVAEGDTAIEVYQEAYLRQDAFHAVILDLNIVRGMGGEKTLALLKDFDPDVKAVVTSGDPHHQLIVNYRQHDLCGVLLKPIRFEAVISLLQEIFGQEVTF